MKNYWKQLLCTLIVDFINNNKELFDVTPLYFHG